MKAIEITCNGKVVCHAGLPENGNLSAILNLLAGPKGKRVKNALLSSFSVGGLSVEGEDYRFFKFFRKDITESDCISLRIVNVVKASRPKSQYVETKAERLKAKQKYLKQVAKELKRKA